MITAWTKHIKDEAEKKQYEQSLHKAKWVLDDVKRLINSSEEALEASEISPKSYDNANWAYRQAHCNGYRQALRDFTQLLTLDQQETDGRQPTRGKPPHN